MTGIATTVCLVLALATALVAGVRALRNRATSTLEIVAAGVLELGVLVTVAVYVVGLVGGHETSGTGLLVAYLIGIALTMPVATALGIAEHSRWGPTVIAAGALVVCVLLARIGQIWTPRG